LTKIHLIHKLEENEIIKVIFVIISIDNTMNLQDLV